MSFLAVILTSAAADTLDLLWPSPLLKLQDSVAASNNKALRKAVLRLASAHPGVRKTNHGGWQSDVDLFEREDKPIILLRTRAYHAVFRYLQAMAPSGAEGRYEVSIGSAWANVNNRTHMNTPHLHPGVQVSGVYYVDDGGDRSGGLRLIDPRLQASMIPVPARWTRGMGEHIQVQAMPGMFVLFPAWLQHYVVAHNGTRPRISISFNIRLTFPTDAEDDQTPRVIESTEQPAARLPPKLSFTVPPHHQQSFLDSKLAQDMVVH
jgi:uncharacterized protein (TIGR02466 family)